MTRDKPIPMSQWGRDHISTFAYAMAMAAGQGGRLESVRMRCCTKRHPGLAHEGSRFGKCPPTRLRDGIELPNHDDWDCLDDIVAAGLLIHFGTGMHPGVVQPTEKAWPIAKKIWAIERLGGKWSSITLEEPV